jgi:Tol biopolymer transport system component
MQRFAVVCGSLSRGRYNFARQLLAAMSDLSSGAAPSGEPADRLDSWKEIAAYLKRDVTTVQRWEKREAMPVYRHLHDKQGSVYAYRSELDAWSRGRNLPAVQEEPQHDHELAAAPTTKPQSKTRALTWPMGVAGLMLAVVALVWFVRQADSAWQSPLADAQFERLTDFSGTEEAAAISRDGRFVAFLSNRDGRTDVWVTQVGTGQFYNLTRGQVAELVNPSIRTMSFSPDGALVTFWSRTPRGSDAGEISVWAVPTLGGQPRPYLEGVAEFDWSNDGSRLAYHTPGPGDPTFVRQSREGSAGTALYTAAAGLHAHFPLWSPDERFLYFVQGTVPDKMDIWRIPPTGGAAEQITNHNARVSHPVMLNTDTLMYLATDVDGTGPWLYSTDVATRMPHRVSSGVDRYTSLAASADGRRLVLTLANPKGTFWRLPVSGTPVDESAAILVSVTTGRGASPRFGRNYLLYVASKGTGDGIWKLADGTATEIWSEPDARIVGSPAIDTHNDRVAFSIEQRGKTRLTVMNADGTNVRVVTTALDLRGSPAWSPDGQSITSAVNVNGSPRLFTIALDGSASPLVQDYSIDPAWTPAGDFVVFSGPDIGTTFMVKAATASGPHALPDLTLTRGARRLRFLPDRAALVVLRGEIQHKNLWLIDLESGAERQLTNLPASFDIRDFDISPDGREIIVDRVQEDSDIVLLERP